MRKKIGYGAVRFRLQSVKKNIQELETLLEDQAVQLDQTELELSTSLERSKSLEKDVLEARNKAHEAEGRALEATRTKSTFLATMSHELRTPMNAILGFVQLMERDDTLSREQRENLDVITRSAEHLLGLINNVLSISKIESGQVILNEETFDLHWLLKGLEEMFQIRAQSKGLQLIFDTDPQLPHFVWGDEGKLRQVLVNLLGNGFKFTDTGSVTLRAQWDHGQAVFEVSDTGHGITTPDQEKLFQVFSQTESGHSSKEGVGLGLAISRNFVRLMGGDISVTSEPAKGSTFSFTVRLLVALETDSLQESRKVVGLEPDQPTYRILVVDNKWENRTLLVRLLSPVGFDVREASNGKEAVEIWMYWEPHLIWMEMSLPVMDGFTATKVIRNTELGILNEEHNADRSSVVIIALSASASEYDRKSMLDAGCDDFVAKPFREATIFEKMIGYLGVRYVYEDFGAAALVETDGQPAKAEVTSEWLATLPPEIITELAHTVTAGDAEAASRVVERIRQLDEPLANELRNMLKCYRFDEILDAVERV